MEYIFYFDIAAIILTCMLLFIIYMRRSFPTPALFAYKAMLILNLIASVTDLISAFTIPASQTFPLWLNYIINMLYLSTHNVTGIFFLLYMLCIVRGNYGTKVERIYWISLISFDVISVFTSPFTHFIFYFDENRIYQHGVGIYLFYGVVFSVLAYTIILFFTHKRLLSDFQIAMNMVFFTFLMAGVLFQAFYPSLLIEPFFCAISLLMMNVALDNPAKYFYQDTSCYNQTAFQATLEQRLPTKQEFSIVAFALDDVGVYRQKFGDAELLFTVREMITRTQRLFKRKNVFLISNYVFAVLVSVGEETDAIEKLTKEISRPHTQLSGAGTVLYPHFCLMKLPGEVKGAGDVIFAIDDMLFHTYQKTGLRVVWDTSRVLERKHRDDEIVHILREALLQDGFSVSYQPIFDSKEKKVVSMEALVRLKDKSLRLYPDEFIPVAEQNGMILDIGAMVLGKVCRFFRDNKLETYGIDHVNVNLSMLQLLRLSAMKNLSDIVAEYGLDSKYINFEITETATADADEINIVKECLDYLLEKGFSFALDDYGSGYSNISSLLQMPFRLVKIDKGILWNAMTSKAARLVLDSTIHLVHESEKAVVCEGVETEEMVKLLDSMHCDYLQGFYYAKPMTEAELIDFLKKQ